MAKLTYPSGEPVSLNDRVIIGYENPMHGVVVGLLHEKLFAPGFFAEHWAEHEVGVLVDTEEAGLILHQDQASLWNFEKA